MIYLTPLTKREIEVLHLISYEYNNGEIAEILGISTSTVDTHRENLYAKLDVRKSAAAVRRGFELKLLPYKNSPKHPSKLSIMHSIITDEKMNF